jgi:sulfonate transport system permease protein
LSHLGVGAAFRSTDPFAGAIGYVTALAMSIAEQRLLKWQSTGH